MDSLLSWSGPLAIRYTICTHTLNVSFVRERWILIYSTVIKWKILCCVCCNCKLNKLKICSHIHDSQLWPVGYNLRLIIWKHFNGIEQSHHYIRQMLTWFYPSSNKDLWSSGFVQLFSYIFLLVWMFQDVLVWPLLLSNLILPLWASSKHIKSYKKIIHFRIKTCNSKEVSCKINVWVCVCAWCENVKNWPECTQEIEFPLDIIIRLQFV